MVLVLLSKFISRKRNYSCLLNLLEQTGKFIFLEIKLLNSTNTIDISTCQPAECQTFHTVTERGNTYLDFFAS